MKKKNLLIIMVVLMVFSIQTYGTCVRILTREVFMNETVSEVKVSNSVNEILVAKVTSNIEDESKEELVNAIKKNENNLKTTKQEENNKKIEKVVSEIKESESSTTLTTPALETPILSELEKVRNDNRELGTFGRLYLPSVNLNVALYNTDISEGGIAQKVVDNRDSAAYFSVYSHQIIADHSHQGFHKIADIPIGEKAYIKKNSQQILVYKLVQKFEGMNQGSDLTDLNGRSVFDETENLIMYTCYKINEYENHVMITIWNLESNS